MRHSRLDDVGGGIVRVTGFEGDATEQKRLADLGLHPGARVEVLQKNTESGMLIAINDDARIVIDTKTSRQVKVVSLEPVMAPLTLSALAPGDRARIVGLGRGRLDYRQKLMSMGLTPGVEFQITRLAPLGDPVEIRVRGFAMSLRRAEADIISVERL